MNLKESLDTYRQAKAVTAIPGDTPFRAEAENLIAMLEKAQWNYPVRCILCDESFMIVATLEAISQWEGRPRGVCDKHSGPEVVVVT